LVVFKIEAFCGGIEILMIKKKRVPERTDAKEIDKGAENVIVNEFS